MSERASASIIASRGRRQRRQVMEVGHPVQLLLWVRQGARGAVSLLYLLLSISLSLSLSLSISGELGDELLEKWRKGTFIYDDHKLMGFFYPLPPLCPQSYVLFILKLVIFLPSRPSFCADVLYRSRQRQSSAFILVRLISDSAASKTSDETDVCLS